MLYEYEMSSLLEGVSVEEVWSRVSTWEGVNYELGPLVQMSVPEEYPRVSDIPADGKVHFTSQVCLFGVIPVDSHRFGLRAIDPPHYFDERSENRMMRVWCHKRTISEMDGSVIVTDQCGFEPRLPILGRVILGVYRLVFRIRHRRLTRYFGQR